MLAYQGTGNRRLERIVTSIRALIVDDHPVTREGLRTALELSEDAIKVVGEAASGEEAVEQARTLAPDVVFMDVRMPGMDGIEVVGLIKEAHPEVVVVLITLEEPENVPAAASSSGAAALVCKQDLGPRLLRRLWLAHAPRR
jgi:DNA-binding NarL/FixJ family response regulator